MGEMRLENETEEGGGKGNKAKSQEKEIRSK